MEGDLVYIEGDLEEEKREWLFHLIRRVEHSGDFRATPDALGPAWIIVIGWGSGDTGPVSISRFGSGLIYTAPDVEGAARKLERWLDKHASKGSET